MRSVIVGVVVGMLVGGSMSFVRSVSGEGSSVPSWAVKGRCINLSNRPIGGLSLPIGEVDGSWVKYSEDPGIDATLGRATWINLSVLPRVVLQKCD